MRNRLLRALAALLTGVVCSGNAQTQPCGSFVATDYTQGKVFIFEQGKIVWEHEAPLSNDVWVLENGNLLFTTGNGVLEVTRDKDTVFCYRSASRIFACQRLADGNTFIGECNAGRLLEVTPRGEIARCVSILPEGVTNAGSAFMRNARRLDDGHYLVAHYGGGRVVEYDERGREVWSVEAGGGPHSVIRLPDGNTLVAIADADDNPRIVEYDPQGREVWRLTNDDLEGRPLRFMSGMQYVEGVGLYLTNWQGHRPRVEAPHLLLVTRDKRVVCTVPPTEGVMTFSSVFVPQSGGRIRH